MPRFWLCLIAVPGAGCAAPTSDHVDDFFARGSQALEGLSAADAFATGVRSSSTQGSCDSGQSGYSTALVSFELSSAGEALEPRHQTWELAQDACVTDGRTSSGMLRIEAALAPDGSATLVYSGYVRPDGGDACGVEATRAMDSEGTTTSLNGTYCDGALDELREDLPIPDYALE